MLVCGRLSSRYSLPEKYVELTSCSIFILRMNCKHSSDMFPIATKRSGTLLHFELDVWWAGRLHISIHTEEAQVPSVMIRGKVASKRFWRGNENEQCFLAFFWSGEWVENQMQFPPPHRTTRNMYFCSFLPRYRLSAGEDKTRPSICHSHRCRWGFTVGRYKCWSHSCVSFATAGGNTACVW